MKPFEDLLSELSALKNHGVRKLIFPDDNLNLRNYYIKKLFQILKSHDFEIVFETRLDGLTPWMFQDLKKAGVTNVIYGVNY